MALDISLFVCVFLVDVVAVVPANGDNNKYIGSNTHLEG